jgi:secreted trypsin-like serine protease
MMQATPMRSSLLIRTLLAFLALGIGIGRLEDSARQNEPPTLSTDTFAEIIGGNLATKPYPYFGRWDRGCGVSLVAPDIVLTAAHCGSIVNHRNVYLGSLEASGGLKRTILQAIPHPNYVSSDKRYDAMLLKLNASALEESWYDTTAKQWVNAKTSLSIIPYNTDENNPKGGDDLLLMGFGKTNEFQTTQVAELYELAVKAYDSSCVSDYETGNIDPSLHICAGYPEGQRDACQGKCRRESTSNVI